MKRRNILRFAVSAIDLRLLMLLRLRGVCRFCWSGMRRKMLRLYRPQPSRTFGDYLMQPICS